MRELKVGDRVVVRTICGEHCVNEGRVLKEIKNEGKVTELTDFAVKVQFFGGLFLWWHRYNVRLLKKKPTKVVWCITKYLEPVTAWCGTELLHRASLYRSVSHAATRENSDKICPSCIEAIIKALRGEK